MSKKRADRQHVSRPANEPVKYPKPLRDCDHRTDNFSGGIQIMPAVTPDPLQPDQPLDDQAVVGYVLRLTEVRCLECGQEFRFVNLPTKGNSLTHPVMLNGNRDMQTPIEPDLLIVSPDDKRGGRHRSKIITPNRRLN